eukprot:7500984-Pyramimonas_sp.AAC.1
MGGGKDTDKTNYTQGVFFARAIYCKATRNSLLPTHKDAGNGIMRKKTYFLDSSPSFSQWA